MGGDGLRDSDLVTRRGRTGRTIFHGWKVVAAGCVIQALHSGLMIQAFGNYAVLLKKEFGWSNTLFAGAFSMTRAESGLLGPVNGWSLERFGIRRMMRIGTVICAIGFLLMSQIQNAWQFFGAFLMVSIGVSMSGFLSVTTATVGWFERRRARALSLTGAGYALGGLAIPGVVLFMRTFGWRWTSACSGLFILAVAFPLTRLFGLFPVDLGQPVDGIDPDDDGENRTEVRAAGVSDIHFTPAEAIRTRAFWMISLGHASALLVVGAVTAHLALYLTTDQGFSLQKASFVGGALPLLQLGGQMMGGYLGDRYSKRLLSISAMFGHMAGLLLLAFAVHPWMVWLFVPLHGIAWGVRGPLMQAMRADYFGATSFGRIMGVSSMVVMFGNMGGPLIAGILADQTHSYRLGFVIVALLAGSGVGFFALATPPAPPVREPELAAIGTA